MTTYYIGQADGNLELCVGTAVLEPLQAPAFLTNFTNAGGSTTTVVPVTLLPTVAPLFHPFIDSSLTTLVAEIVGSMTSGRLTLTSDIVCLSAAVLPGAFSLLTSIQGAVYGVPLMLGSLPTQTIPIPTADLIGEQNDGRRPVFPWIVVLRNVSSIYELTEDGGTTYKVNDLEPFVVSDDFANDADDLLTRAGGLAGYLGIVLDTPSGKAIRFRPPYAGEVVVLKTDMSVWRWSVDEAAWAPHTTLPQRALNGLEALQILDADRIYDYYAKVMGLVLAKSQYDSKRILDLVDPVSAPDEFLSLLLNNFGADDFEFEESPEGKRELLRTFLGIMQRKGTPLSITLALRSLGFSGYASHVWAKPLGDPLDVIDKPFGYDQATPTNGATEYFPTSQINIHLAELDGDSILAIDSTTRERVARFLRRNVLPAHVFIKWFVSDRVLASDTVAITDLVGIAP